MFAGTEPYDQVYDYKFFLKDIFYTLGGLILAINWKYQCVKIYMGLKNSRLNSLRIFFKNYNASYLTGIGLVLCLCAVSRQFYLPLVESFSSLSFFFNSCWSLSLYLPKDRIRTRGTDQQCLRRS